MGRLSESSMVNLKNKSHSVTADIVVPDGGASGVLIAQGALSAAGPSTCTRGGRSTATACSACSGSTPRGTRPSRARPTQVRMEFDYEGGGLARGGRRRCTSMGTRSAKVAWRDGPDGVLSRRDGRRRLRGGTASARTTRLRQPLRRLHQLGADRRWRGCRRRRSPDQPRGAPAGSDDAAIGFRAAAKRQTQVSEALRHGGFAELSDA